MAHASHCISIFCEVIASTKRLSSHSKAAGPRNQRLCLVPHTCRFLGQQSSGCRTDSEGLKSSRVAPTLPVTRRGRPVRPSKNSAGEKVFCGESALGARDGLTPLAPWADDTQA